jgi:hypothetical protein
VTETGLPLYGINIQRFLPPSSGGCLLLLAGKSTLLRLIMGREKPSVSGRVGLGEHNIVPNYFEQNQAEALDGELTVLDTLIQVSWSGAGDLLGTHTSGKGCGRGAPLGWGEQCYVVMPAQDRHRTHVR